MAKNENNLKPCPWCGQIPIFVSSINKHNIEYNFQVACIYEKCRARPSISFDKGYTREQVTVVWNSYGPRGPYRNADKVQLSDFRKYISRNELRSILIDAMCSEEIWSKYLPEFQYLSSASDDNRNS